MFLTLVTSVSYFILKLHGGNVDIYRVAGSSSWCPARSPYVVSWNPVNISMLAVRAKNLAWIHDISTGLLVEMFAMER